MTRTLLSFASSLCVVIAAGILTAPLASAQFEAETAPTTITTSSNQMQKFAPTAGGTAVECTHKTNHGSVSATITVHFEVSGTYESCEPILGLPTSINTNGCTFLFHLAAGSTSGTTDVKCPAGKSIVVNVGTGPFCQYTVGETGNQGLGSVSFDNVGSGSTREITVTPKVSGITSTRTVNGFGCPSAGSKGSYEGDETWTGENGSGHVGIFVD